MILSDNAKTFKASRKLIQTVFCDKEVRDNLMHFGVEWKFNLKKLHGGVDSLNGWLGS